MLIPENGILMILANSFTIYQTFSFYFSLSLFLYFFFWSYFVIYFWNMFYKEHFEILLCLKYAVQIILPCMASNKSCRLKVWSFAILRRTTSHFPSLSLYPFFVCLWGRRLNAGLQAHATLYPSSPHLSSPTPMEKRYKREKSKCVNVVSCYTM